MTRHDAAHHVAFTAWILACGFIGWHFVGPFVWSMTKGWIA